MDSAKTRVLSFGRHDGAGVTRDDAMLQAVRDAAAGVYDLLGELGRNRRGSVVFLGRELATGNLTALKLEESSSDPNELELSVAAELDESVPALGYECQYCGQRLDSWGRFCTFCGRDVSGVATGQSTPDARLELLAAVQAAAEGEYEILGEMPRARGGGIVYFARETSSGMIVALRLQRDQSFEGGSEAEYSLGKTQVLKPIVQGDDVTPVGGYQRPGPPSDQPSPRPDDRAPALAEGHEQERVPKPEIVDQPTPEQLPPRRFGRFAVLGVGALAVVAILAVALSSSGDNSSPIHAQPDPGPGPLPQPLPPPPPPEPVLVVPDSAELILERLPPGTQVRINGVRLRGTAIKLAPGTGLLEATAKLAPGTHLVEATAPGFRPVRERLELAAGSFRRGLRWSRLPDSTTGSLSQSDSARRVAPPPPPTCASASAAKDWQSARQLCASEAQQGSAEAARRLGVMFLRGDGGAISEADAVGWFEQAVQRGDRDAQYELGRVFQSSSTHRNEPRALELFTRAGNRGHDGAQFQAAIMYEKGIGTPKKNLAEAFNWFRRAAEQGHAGAQAGLGIFYLKGQGTRENHTLALEWLRKGASNGSADAMYYLGEMYEEGKAGLPKSREEAFAWYRKSAELGNAEAKRALRRE